MQGMARCSQQQAWPDWAPAQAAQPLLLPSWPSKRQAMHDGDLPRWRHHPHRQLHGRLHLQRSQLQLLPQLLLPPQVLPARVDHIAGLCFGCTLGLSLDGTDSPLLETVHFPASLQLQDQQHLHLGLPGHRPVASCSHRTGCRAAGRPDSTGAARRTTTSAGREPGKGAASSIPLWRHLSPRQNEITPRCGESGHCACCKLPSPGMSSSSVLAASLSAYASILPPPRHPLWSAGCCAESRAPAGARAASSASSSCACTRPDGGPLQPGRASCRTSTGCSCSQPR